MEIIIYTISIIIFLIIFIFLKIKTEKLENEAKKIRFERQLFFYKKNKRK